MSYIAGEPPWHELDSGIVDTVRKLWNAGFKPVDSGDGVSKFRDGTANRQLAMNYPHVVMICEPLYLVDECRRLLSLVNTWNSFAQIRGSYAAEHDQALITLHGVLGL